MAMPLSTHKMNIIFSNEPTTKKAAPATANRLNGLLLRKKTISTCVVAVIKTRQMMTKTLISISRLTPKRSNSGDTMPKAKIQYSKRHIQRFNLGRVCGRFKNVLEKR